MIYNLKKDPEDTRDYNLKSCVQMFNSEQLPSTLDLSTIGTGMPPVLNQLNLGSCTANSLSNICRFQLKRNNLKEFQPSRLFIYYFSRLLDGNVGEDSGASLRNVMKAVAKYGACSEVSHPYDIKKFKIEPNETNRAGALTHVSKFSYMSVNQNLTSIKNAIARGYPIAFGMYIYESFESEQVAKTGIVPIPKDIENCLGGHCMMIVGYNDFSKYFKILNSWGPTWGEKGYAYIPYDYILDKTKVFDFWICSDFN